MATCDSEFTVFEKDTTSAPKCRTAWTKKASGGFVCFENVYSNTSGRIKYRVPGGSTRYLDVTQGSIYTYTYNNYKYTIEIILVFMGIAGSNAIKVKTCYESTTTPTPVPQTGSLQITTTPPEATVRIDGQTWWQPTNCTVTRLSTGAHNVEILKSGYQSDYSLPIINANQTTTLSVILQPIATPTPTPQPDVGQISCITNPSGATVQIDYQTFWKPTNCLVPNVPVGNHTISYILSGHQDWTKSIYLSKGETEIVSAILIKLADAGSIKCTCNVIATVTINDGNPQTTPYTYTGLKENTYYTIRFTKPNYTAATQHILVKGAATAHGTLTYQPTFGFDINVNIPGLTANMNKKLWVEPVTKIPFTDTWIPSSVHGGIQWEWVSNRTYIAKDSAAKCDPQPNKYFTGSTNKLEKSKDYAIFVGDVILETFPDKLVHKTGTTTPTTINLTEDYYDFLSEKVCGFIGVSPDQCSNWFGALLVDLVSPIADLYVIVNHRSLYTNEPEDPTRLTYLCAAIGCIPIGGVIKHAGKLKYVDQLTEIASAAKKNSEVYTTLVKYEFIAKVDQLSSYDLQKIVDAAKQGNINLIRDTLNKVDIKLSYDTLNSVVRNIDEIATDYQSHKTLAQAIGFSTTNGFRSLKLLKGASTGQLKLTEAQGMDIIHLAGNTPPEYRKIIHNMPASESTNFINKAKNLDNEWEKVVGSLHDHADYYARKYKASTYDASVDNAIKNIGKAAEKTAVHPQGSKYQAEVIDGTVHYVKKLEPVLDGPMKADSLNEATNIFKAAADNPITSWKNTVPTKQVSLLNRVIAEAKSNPLTKIIPATGVSIAILWYINKNAEDLLGIEATTRNVPTSKITWQIKDKMAIVDANFWNVQNAENAENWTVFCSAMSAYRASIDDYNSFGELHKTSLIAEGTYGTFVSFTETYNLAYSLKEQVHSCGLPSEFTATVAEYVDGDSIWLNINNVKTECRLLGINTPENGSYKYKCTDQPEPYLVRRLTVIGGACVNETIWNVDKSQYESCNHALTQLLPMNSTVTCSIDPANEDDKYGRKLVVITRNGININKEMLAKGVAVAFFYETNSQVNTSNFLAAEANAKNAKTGVWRFEAGTGSIHCVSEGKTASKIWLDGQDTGETTVNEEFTLEHILLGNHTVTFTKSYYGKDYECTKDNVYVYKDQTAQASCTLTTGDEPQPDDTGTIYCRSGNETACEIWMDDIYTGHKTENSVYLLKDVPVGTHTIKFSKWKDGTKYECNVEVYVSKGEQTTAECALEIPGACPSPTASYVMSPSSPKNGDAVSLNALDSSGGTNHFVTTYEWYLDQIKIGTGVYFSFTATTGNHVLSLKVINDCLNSDTASKSFNVGTVTCPNPTASFVMSPSSPKNGETITLNASDSSGGTGSSINKYEWILDQSFIGFGVYFSFTATSGNHTLTLKITNKCLNTDTATKTFNVGAAPTPLDKTGSIYCNSENMTACTIWLDGEYTAHNTSSNVYLLKNVPIGSHEITFKKSKDGINYSCSKTVTVYENKQVTAKCWLNKLAIFPVDFISYPSNATITKL